MHKVTYFNVVIFGLVLATTTVASADKCVEQADQIQQTLFAGDYDKAEPAVRECVKKHPKEVAFLSRLDIVLNGQGKYTEASKLRKQILDIWHQYYEADWRARGSPVAESSWARMVLSTKDYLVIGTEYFVPQLLNEEPPLKAFYKIIALPRSKEMKARLFKLEMSQWDDTKFHVLREQFQSGGKQIVQYGEKRPAFHRMVIDAVAYLEQDG